MRNNAFVPSDYEVFSGLDVDKRSISVTFNNQQGPIRSLRMPNSVEHLVNHVRKHFLDQKVAFVYEAGPTGNGLYDGLVAQGYRCLIASPSMIPKAPGQRVKTNRLDSVGLAENLRGGQIKSIHVPSPVYRELRHLTQLRDTFVSFWPASGIGASLKTSANWEDFWDWCPPSTPPEIEPIGDRSPRRETDG